MCNRQVPSATVMTVYNGATRPGSHHGTSANTLGSGKATKANRNAMATPIALTTKMNTVRIAWTLALRCAGLSVRRPSSNDP
jgi:hypothetical protein